MERSRQSQLHEVARILKDWQGSDATEMASPSAVAREIDQLYAEYLATLPEQVSAIRQGRKEWERKVG